MNSGGKEKRGKAENKKGRKKKEETDRLSYFPADSPPSRFFFLIPLLLFAPPLFLFRPLLLHDHAQPHVHECNSVSASSLPA